MTSELDFEVSFSSFLKQAHNKGVFSFIIHSQLRWPIELKFSQICLFMHVEIHQVRRLVFDNLTIVPSVFNLIYVINTNHYGEIEVSN